MNTGKKITLIVTLLLGSIGGYSLVFGSNLIFDSNITFITTVSPNIYTENTDLSSTIVVYKADTDISSYNIYSSCKVESSFLESYKTLYFFRIQFSGEDICKNENIVLESSQGRIPSTITKLSLYDKGKELEIFLDYSTGQLYSFLTQLELSIKKNTIYKNYTQKQLVKNYRYLKGQRVYQESSYKKKVIEGIIQAREQAYSIPVSGGVISSKSSKVPNAGRPYRSTYTDGIHHGWDVLGKLGKDVRALDDGIIVRVVRDFNDRDFQKIDYFPKDMQQKSKNLDTLRGKQVWIKTMKGEVVFYSHLQNVPLNIQEGMFVSRNETLGSIGISGIPEKGYDDYHLHFSVMENPYKLEKAGLYDFGDYMSWDWKLKNKSYNEVIEEQKKIFE